MNDENSDEKINMLNLIVLLSLFKKMPQHGIFMHCLPASRLRSKCRSISWSSLNCLEATQRMIAKKVITVYLSIAIYLKKLLIKLDFND